MITTTPESDTMIKLYTISSVVGAVILLILVIITILIVGFWIRQKKKNEGMKCN